MPQNYYDQRFSNHARVGGHVNNYTVFGSGHNFSPANGVQNFFSGFPSPGTFRNFPQGQGQPFDQAPGYTGTPAQGDGWRRTGSFLGKFWQFSTRI